MLETKKRRVWFVVSAAWIVLTLAIAFWQLLTEPFLTLQFLFGDFIIYGFGPVALGWGLFVGLPAMVRWIRAGK